MSSRFLAFFLTGLLLVCPAQRTLAQDGSNVLVVRNEASPDSQQIAARYAAARRIPSENILPIAVSAEDEIDRSQYAERIEAPIAQWLNRNSAQDRILYIVLTKGIPLRVKGTAGLDGTVASVDSELTLLYRRLLGIAQPTAGRIQNPYFLGERPIAEAKAFSHSAADIYLVTRLDGFSTADVFRLIDRGAAPVRDGQIILDQRASVLGERGGDEFLAAAAARLSASGVGDRVVLDSSREVVSGRKQVLGYYSWGSNDPAIKRRRFDFGFVPGSLAAMFVSTDGRTFKEPPDTWSIGSWSDPHTFYGGSPQSLAGDLIREGATGVAGHVSEPYLDATIRPQILFPAYVAGFNLVESFYLAMPYLSWQTVVVGDPLCAPFQRTALSTEQAAPALDPDTELPTFFSARRLAVIATSRINMQAAKAALQGNARLVRGDKAGARASLERALAVDPKLPGIPQLLASLYEQAGDYDLAIARYKAILVDSPNDLASLNNLAYGLAVRKNSPAEALPLALKAYTLSKGEAHISDTLGWIYFLLGSQSEAEKFLSLALAGAPENADVQLHQAHLHAKAGRKKEALASLDEAIKLDPKLGSDEAVRQLKASLTR